MIGVLPNHTRRCRKHDNGDAGLVTTYQHVRPCEAYLRCGALTTLGETAMAAKKAAKKPAKKAAKKAAKKPAKKKAAKKK